MRTSSKFIQCNVVEDIFLSKKCEADSAHIYDLIFQWILKFAKICLHAAIKNC